MSHSKELWTKTHTDTDCGGKWMPENYIQQWEIQKWGSIVRLNRIGTINKTLYLKCQKDSDTAFYYSTLLENNFRISEQLVEKEIMTISKMMFVRGQKPNIQHIKWSIFENLVRRLCGCQGQNLEAGKLPDFQNLKNGQTPR